MIYVITFLLSGISMLYEFTLAQLIALFFGSTFEIYALTIGLYTCSLGLGALYYEKRKRSVSKTTLFYRTELALSLVALGSPFLIIALSSYPSISSLGVFAKVLAFVPVVFCGWLSGIELPCLISLSLKDSEQEVLLIDFVGMFFGAALFSLVLIDSLGPLTLMWTLCLINILSVFIYFVVSKLRMGKSAILLGLMSVALISFCLLCESEIIEYFKGLHSV